MVNFSPYYPTPEPDKLVTTKIYTSKITSVLCPEDILSSEVRGSNQVRTLTMNIPRSVVEVRFGDHNQLFCYIAFPSIERGVV